MPDGGQEVCTQALTDILLVVDDSECDETVDQFIQGEQRPAMEFIGGHEGAAYRYAMVNVPGCPFPNGDDAGWQLWQGFEDGPQSFIGVSLECVPTYCPTVSVRQVADEAADGGIVTWELGAAREVVVIQPGTDISAAIDVLTTCLH